MKLYIKICIPLLLAIATIMLIFSINKGYNFTWDTWYVRAISLSIFFIVFLKYRRNTSALILSCVLLSSFEINDLLIEVELFSQSRTQGLTEEIKKVIYLIAPFTVALFYIFLSLSRIKTGLADITKIIIILSSSFLLMRLTINAHAIAMKIKSAYLNPYWTNTEVLTYILDRSLWQSIDIILLGFLLFYLSKLKKYE